MCFLDICKFHLILSPLLSKVDLWTKSLLLKVDSFLAYTDEGSSFVFGYLANPTLRPPFALYNLEDNTTAKAVAEALNDAVAINWVRSYAENMCVFVLCAGYDALFDGCASCSYPRHLIVSDLLYTFLCMGCQQADMSFFYRIHYNVVHFVPFRCSCSRS